MANLQNTTGSPAAARSGETMQEVRDRWAGEVHTTDWPPVMEQNQLQMRSNGMQMNPDGQMQMSQNWQMQQNSTGQMQQNLNMSNQLPSEVIESPTTMNEAYLGSLKAMLHQNKGNYIVATFLVGTQGTVSWEGVLYEVGNDYMTIYQPGRDRYIVSDIYSLKYIEFYDTQRRDMCDRILRERNWQSGNNGSW